MSENEATPQEKAKIKGIFESLTILAQAMDDLRTNHRIHITFNMGIIDGVQKVLSFEAARHELIKIDPKALN